LPTNIARKVPSLQEESTSQNGDIILRNAKATQFIEAREEEWEIQGQGQEISTLMIRLD
jgi:hypothetical protein